MTHYYKMKMVDGDFYTKSKIALRSAKQATDLLHEQVFAVSYISPIQYLWGKIIYKIY